MGTTQSTQVGCLAAPPPGAHMRDRYSIPHPARKSDHSSHRGSKHIVYASASIHDKLSPSAGADVVLIIWLARGRRGPSQVRRATDEVGFFHAGETGENGEGRSRLHSQGLGWGR